MFGRRELERGLANAEYYEEVGKDDIEQLLREGHMLSSAYVHLEGETSEGGRKGRFVQDFHLQSQQ